jgi:hypothetical protein
MSYPTPPGDKVHQQAPSSQDNSEEETTSNSTINLQYLKSAMASHQLQPPLNFRSSSDKLVEVTSMSKDDKWAARKRFNELSAKEKAKVEVPSLEVAVHVASLTRYHYLSWWNTYCSMSDTSDY